MDEKTIQEKLLKIGIMPNVKGYRYWVKAILLVKKDPSLQESITKGLYPKVAKEMGTTGTRVERALRHAIEMAYNQGNEEYKKIFGYCGDRKPKNSEALVVLGMSFE